MKKLLVVMVLLVLMVQRVDGRFTNNCAHSVIGDISGDGVVSLADLSMLAASYGARVGETRFDSNADLNCDGVIGWQDEKILRVGWVLFENRFEREGER